MGIVLEPFRIEAGEHLQHVSRIEYRGQLLYYGNGAANRYDAPDRTYGVLYLGFDLATALMESVFHEHQWDEAPDRTIALAEINSRLVRVICVVDNLRLADLTAPGVMTSVFGLNLEQLVARDYRHTQRVSDKVHSMLDAAMQPRFDGILFPSRNNYPGLSIALFDRAKTKIRVDDDIDLPDHKDWPQFVDNYALGISPDPGPSRREED